MVGENLHFVLQRRFFDVAISDCFVFISAYAAQERD